MKKLLPKKPNKIFEYLYNGIATYSYKTEIPLLGHWLVFSLSKSDFIKPLNAVLVQISIVMILFIVVLYYLINKIARSFSVPIQNTIKMMKQLAEGDLTVENHDSLADEFGLLIDNIRIFQKKLRDIMQQVMNAAVQLSSSAEELASTSQGLSENAQVQAASVEEASASLEEVSAAVEHINNNANTQAELAKATNVSMQDLKDDNQTVVNYASEALNTAHRLTEQANTGQTAYGKHYCGNE